MNSHKIAINVASNYLNSLFTTMSMNDELKQIEYALSRELEFFKVSDHATNDERDEFNIIDNDIHDFYDRLVKIINDLNNWIDNFEIKRNQT
ncbi:MAG TPA: hypothetical protein ENI61_05230 [Ignavibacteria bacterium]|nr:hypothetical protein [Ignavibacteria bacterium]